MAKRRQALTVFLDSSVLFSATSSVTGGSAKALTIKKIDLFVSRLVLAEVERNVRLKLESHHLDRFFRLASQTVILDQLPTKEQISKAKEVIMKKDAPILASAKLSQANFLLTLDKKHFLTEKVIQYLKPTKVLTPKMFFKELKQQ